MPAQHTRSTGLLCGRPVALELSTRQLKRSGSWQGQLQTSAAESAFIYTVLKDLAYMLDMFRGDMLYKFTYLVIVACLTDSENYDVDGDRSSVPTTLGCVHTAASISRTPSKL